MPLTAPCKYHWDVVTDRNWKYNIKKMMSNAKGTTTVKVFSALNWFS